MNKATYIVIILIASCLASCAFSAKKKAEAITALEESLKQSSKNHISDTAKVKELLADYEYYYTHYTKDSLTPIYLMRSGNFNRAIGLSEKAVKCYRTIYTDFPQYPRADMAMMLEGYTYENDLHNTAKAKESYELYLTKYPQGKMTADVHFLIDHLGMTPEQIMAEIDSIKRTRGDVQTP